MYRHTTLDKYLTLKNNVTFSAAAKKLLSQSEKILKLVEAALNDNKTPFNVSAFAKKLHKQYGWDEFFAVWLIRTAVNQCTEYYSRVGRCGGIVKHDEKAIVKHFMKQVNDGRLSHSKLNSMLNKTSKKKTSKKTTKKVSKRK